MDAIIKIFKYVVYIILLYGVFVISTNLITHAEETRYEIIVDEVNYYDTNDNLQEIKLLNENKILVFENNTYLIKNNNLVKIDNELVDYEIKEEDIYKLFNHKFCINENEFIDEECLFKDFYLDQKYIYLVGTKKSDAVIIKLNYKLEIIKEILLGGEGNEQFVNVNVISNKLYIIGEKDAVSNNSIFKNVGSENTKKVFIIKYDEELEKELYFNFSEEDEFFQQVLYLEDYISILFKNGKIVKFDYKLNLLENNQPFTNTDFISKDINNEIIRFKINKNKLYLNEKILFSSENSFNFIVDNNKIIIYEILENQIKETYIFPYEILRNDNLICSYFNLDLDTLSNIEVVSYLEKINISIDKSDPYLQKQICGNYKIKYLIQRESGKSFYLDGNLIIKEYVNVSNNAVYKTNKELRFLGKGYLNNLSIHSGYVITEEGEYDLKIVDANNNEKVYKFNIVKDYYKDNDICEFEADYNVNIGEDITVEVLIEDPNLIVENVIINNNNYGNFIISDNKLLITIPSKDYYSIDNYVINKIICNNAELIINKELTIKTIKKEPSFIVYQSVRNNNHLLEYEIIDTFKSIEYFKIDIYSQDILIDTVYEYFDNEIELKNKYQNDNYHIKCYLGFHNGNELIEKEILVLNTKTNDFDKIIKIDYDINKSISKLEIEINKNVEKLSIQQTNLLSNVKVIEPKISLLGIIIISITIGVVVILVGVIVKKIKTKKLNY